MWLGKQNGCCLCWPALGANSEVLQFLLVGHTLGHNNKIHCFTGNFFSPNHAHVHYLKFNLWPLYHSFLLVQRGLHLLLLSLQTVGLVSQARLVMFCSANRFQYLYQISNWRCSCHGNGKGRACATNLSFEKVVSWQDIDRPWKLCLMWSGRRRSKRSTKKTILPVETIRGWTEQLDHNKYWKVNMRHWLRR